MKRKTANTFVFSLILVFSILLPVSSAETQTEFVRVKFEVDGEEVEQGFRLFVNVNNREVEAIVNGNLFLVPQEVSRNERVDVRFVSGEYDLYFRSVHRSAFDTEWVVGVDNEPFSEGSLESSDLLGRRLRLVYYIKFHPANAEGTVLVTQVYDNNPR